MMTHMLMEKIRAKQEEDNRRQMKKHISKFNKLNKICNNMAKADNRKPLHNNLY